MSAHPSFSSNPDQSPHKYFKNLLLKFKKEIKKNTEKTYLEEKMEDLINAAKQMIYIDSPKNSIFHKPETQKAIEKVAALIENATPDRDYRREVPTSGKSHFAEKNLTKRGRA